MKMLDYTRMMLKNTQRDLSTFGYILGLISQLFALAYIIVAITLNIGNTVANAIVLAVSATYFGIYLVLHDTKDKRLRRIKNTGKHSAAAVKLLSGALTLGVSIYGICISAYTLSVPTLLLSVANAAFWVLRVIVELVSYYVDTRIELFTAALGADFEFVSKPIGIAKNAIKTVMGQSVEAPEPRDKYRIALDRQMEKEKQEKKRTREASRAEDGDAPKGRRRGPLSRLLSVIKRGKKKDVIESIEYEDKTEPEREQLPISGGKE